MTVDEIAAMRPDELKALPEMKQKVLENLVRRVARRRGLEVQRCRIRDTLAPGHGLYRVSSYRTREVVAGGEPHPYSMTLTDIARELAKEPNRYVSRSRRLVD
jgi:hypothetical protein